MSKKVKKKQATLFQLKGVLVVKDFNDAKKCLLDDSSSTSDQIKSLKHLLQKLPGRTVLEENRELCTKIFTLSKSDPPTEVSKLAKDLKKLWRSHHKKLSKIKTDYEIQRDKGFEILTRRLPQIPMKTHKIIDQIIHDQNDQKSPLFYKKRVQTILKKVIFRIDLHEKLKNADSKSSVQEILAGI